MSTACLRKKLTSQLGVILNKNLTFVHQECVLFKYTTGAVHKPLNFPHSRSENFFTDEPIIQSIQVYGPCHGIICFLHQVIPTPMIFLAQEIENYTTKLISQCCNNTRVT